MRRALPALALFAATVLQAQTSCPTEAPNQWMYVTPTCESCFPFVAGNPVAMGIFPQPAPPPPCTQPLPCGPYPVYGGYKIQACDKVAWNFGDGSPEVTVIGQSTITHTYTTPGRYQPAVTVTNALGSAMPREILGVTIASNSPTWVGFERWITEVPETAGSVTFKLLRSGNLNTTAKVHIAHSEGQTNPPDQGEAIAADVVFNPGETTKTFTMKIYDDHLYGLPVMGCLTESATDGTLFSTAPGCYRLIEADPQPTGVIEDLRVPEGAKMATVFVNFSAPFAQQVSFWATASDGTAKRGSDYFGSGAISNMAPGKTQCSFSFYLAADDVPEPDETFTVSIDRPLPNMLRSTATVTIVNDDATLTPPSMQIFTGTHVSLKLDIGQPPATPLTIPLQSSSPEVLDVPASVTFQPGESTVNISVRALQAGLSRVTAGVPGTNTPAALITVVDTVAVVADPSAITLRTGSDADVSLSMQPSRATSQTVSLWSTRPAVATAPASLTIPAGGKATFTVHALESGAATIWIVTSDGFSFPIEVTVGDRAAASVARIEPPNAPASGGSSVTLIGEGLDARCSVAFGSTAATALTPVSNGLSVVVPAHDPGVVDVTVTCGATQVVLPTAFTYIAPRRRATR